MKTRMKKISRIRDVHADPGGFLDQAILMSIYWPPMVQALVEARGRPDFLREIRSCIFFFFFLYEGY